MFTVEERTRVRDRLLELASEDERIVAAAIVGSLADGGGDRWSDVDLTFAVADGVGVANVLDDWTSFVADQLDGVVLFDLPFGPTTYRVFFLPSSLQVDLSFTPAAQFRPGGPKFELVFGTALEVDAPRQVSPHDTFGWAVTFAFAARASIEREKPWMAEHLITAVRDHALALACLRQSLPSRYGKGLDELPEEVLDGFADTRVRSLDNDELRRALAASVDALLRESEQVADVAERIAPNLRELVD